MEIQECGGSFMYVVNLCIKGYVVLLKRRIMLDTKNMYRIWMVGRSWREHLEQEKIE